MTALYKLTDQYMDLLRLANSEEATEEEVAAKVHSILDNFNTKAESIGMVYLDMSSDMEAIKVEEARLAKRRKSIETNSAWIKKYLMAEMIAIHQEKIKGSLVTLSVRKSPPSVEISNLANIPAEYWHIIPETKEVNKRAIADHFKDTGEIVAGTTVVTDKQYLSIT